MPGTSAAHATKRWPVRMLLGALFLSGVAGIVNQVIWQRALKIYLSGSESISAMIVVLIFMLGLGMGSWFMGLRAHRVRSPLKTLAIVELGLAVFNGLICLLLSLDLSDSVHALQRLVQSLGIPLRVLFGFSASLILLLPCFLMGLTIPLASAGCQRTFQLRENRFLSVVFFLNTLGAVTGALLSGFLLLPLLGQRQGLLIAIGFNALAGILAYWLSVGRSSLAAKTPEQVPRRRFHPGLVLGFCLGFLSLAYEMVLFRIMALAHQPFPWVFSLVLCCFLAAWSAGVIAAKRLPQRIGLLLIICAASILLASLLATLQTFGVLRWNPWLISSLYILPCFPFGLLFTQVVTRYAKTWGNDVGRYFGLNTFGSCLGILAMSLVGFHFSPTTDLLVLAAGLLALLPYLKLSWDAAGSEVPQNRWQRVALITCAVLFACQLSILLAAGSRPQNQVDRTYYGTDGVIEIRKSGRVYLDGICHTYLSWDENHVGSHNWYMAVAPLLSRNTDRVPEVCNIGMAIGVTAVTLARSRAVDSIDAYEIFTELEQVLRDYPDETLGVIDNPKIKILWQDGRSGLALSDKRYDMITQAPLYVQQAGSSLLLSEEHFQMVKRRLKPGGLFCIYAYTFDNRAQAQLIRKTLASVFEHRMSFGGGYLMIASERPFTYDRASIERHLADDPLLRAECERVGIDNLLRYVDEDTADWSSGDLLITDDHPIIEYPDLATWLVGGKAD